MSRVGDDRFTLSHSGFMLVDEGFDTAAAAFEVARAVIEDDYDGDGLGPLSIIGDFVLPPAEGPKTRDFQTLHFDFGLPLHPKVDQDVARYTALHIPVEAPDVSALTRLVPLGALLQQRAWPAPTELLENLVTYGRTHGAWDDTLGYVEGSLARIIEAAAGSTPDLPSVKLNRDFLCGLEFDSLRAEVAFFAQHGLRVRDVAVDIALRPGELLIFDNLAVAHGRRGTRAPGELHQRVFGHAGLAPVTQRELRARVLSAFRAGNASLTARAQFDADSFDDMQVREAGDELIVETTGHGTRPGSGEPFHMQYLSGSSPTRTAASHASRTT